MLKRVIIKGFRNLDIDVELEPLTILIGKSGTGKTNFVDALRFLRDFLNHNRETANQFRIWEYWQNIFNVRDASPSLYFEITFSIPGFKELFKYELKSDKENSLSESAWCGSTQLLTRTNQECSVPLTPSADGNIRHDWYPEIDFSEDFCYDHPHLVSLFDTFPILGHFSGIPELSLMHQLLASGIGNYDFPSDVMTETGNKVSEFTLADHGENYLPIFRNLWIDLNNFGPRKVIEDTLRTLRGTLTHLELSTPLQNEIRVAHRSDEVVFSIPLRDESEGFRRMLAHLLAMYQLPRKQTLIFEEPERGIYPGGFSTLADEFKNCVEKERGQVILTTHSPQLLDHFEPESFRVVELEDNSTRIRRLCPEQFGAIKEALMFPGELFTVDTARGETQSEEEETAEVQ